MNTRDFDYALPETLIAQKPLRQRERCKLCVIDRRSHEISHSRFDELGKFLVPGDLLVINNSRVVRARIPCRKEGSGGAVEIFILDPPGAVGQREFSVFLKPARRAAMGCLLRPELNPELGAFEVLAHSGEEAGKVRWNGPTKLTASILEGLGVVPLPPYIKRVRLPLRDESKIDARYYQTIYAREDGSAAAPTAGLHFSQVLVSGLKKKGIRFSEVTLHVGAGTFLPVKSETLEDHHMHRERYELSSDTISAIGQAKKEGRRVIAVGTTSLRVLESAFDKQGNAQAGPAETDIYITPGYSFKVTDALITNFHQPKSTLLALISAFYDRERILGIYQQCIEKKYRFLSYGDAMLLF